MKPELLRRLAAVKARPDLAKELDPKELTQAFAELVSFVQTINSAIKEGRLDGKDGETPRPDVDFMSLATAQKMLTDLSGNFTSEFENERALLIQAVDEKLQQIRDGEDGIVSDEEIERAASIAAGLIELPDFEKLKELDSEKVREAFGDIQIQDVDGLSDALERIATMRSPNGGGTIGKNQVYNFIKQAVTDGTIPAASGLVDGDYGDVTVGGSGTTITINDASVQIDDLDATGTADGTTFLRGDGTWTAPSGSGDVVGPASAIDSRIAAFDTTTGKLLKDGGSTVADVLDRTNHTGTQTASTISDFDTEVSNNASVAANTAKVTNATHTGDVTGDTALTIADEAVTNAKLAHVATSTIKGRVTAATGDVEDLTATQARSILNVEDGANDYSHPNHTGDVTSTGDGATVIADEAVTLPKMAHIATNRLLGRVTAATGDVESLTATQARSLLNIENGATADQTDAEIETAINNQLGGVVVGSTDTQTVTNKDLTATTNKLRDSKSITIESPTATEDLSFFFSNKAITITEMRCVLRGSATPSVTWTVRHGTDRSLTGAEVVTSGTTTTSTTTGSDVTTFNDATIVADSFVWVETTAQSGTVDALHLTVFYDED